MKNINQKDLFALVDELRADMAEIKNIEQEKMFDTVNTGKGYLEHIYLGVDRVTIIYKPKKITEN